LAKKGVHVITVLPGFVETKMTAEMELPGWLTAHPDEVANRIFRALTVKNNRIYVRRIWWPIMLIIKNIPEFIFKRTKI
jgi:short-subunit dehydrogenase